MQGDYRALHEAFGGNIPLERIETRQKRIWGEMENRLGTYKSFRVLGTIPSERVSATLVQYVFEMGTETIQFKWGQQGLMGIQVPANPIRIKFLPQTATEFIGYDIGTTLLTKVQFNLDNSGAVTGLTISGRTASRL